MPHYNPRNFNGKIIQGRSQYSEDLIVIDTGRMTITVGPGKTDVVTTYYIDDFSVIVDTTYRIIRAAITAHIIGFYSTDPHFIVENLPTIKAFHLHKVLIFANTINDPNNSPLYIGI